MSVSINTQTLSEKKKNICQSEVAKNNNFVNGEGGFHVHGL